MCQNTDCDGVFICQHVYLPKCIPNRYSLRSIFVFVPDVSPFSPPPGRDVPRAVLVGAVVAEPGGTMVGWVRSVRFFRALQPAHHESRAAGPRRLQVHPARVGTSLAGGGLGLLGGVVGWLVSFGLSRLSATLYPGNRGSASWAASFVSCRRTTCGLSARRFGSSVSRAARPLQFNCSILSGC